MKPVSSGAQLRCVFGTSSSQLIVLPKGINFGTIPPAPAATIMDFLPVVNVPPFGSCLSPSHPLFPLILIGRPPPCVPLLTAPWLPMAPTITVLMMPILEETSILTCQLGGIITITQAGQETVKVTPESLTGG
jgi:hypothetical protein